MYQHKFYDAELVEVQPMRFEKLNDDIIMTSMIGNTGIAYIWCGKDKEEIAHLDGFSSFDEMLKWFMKRYGGNKIFSLDFDIIIWKEVE